MTTRQQIVQVEARCPGWRIPAGGQAALASENYLGKNCIACHQVPAGTVLGLVSMKVSLDKVNAAVRRFMWQRIVAAGFDLAAADTWASSCIVSTGHALSKR